jgi:predicted Zn-dependent protease
VSYYNQGKTDEAIGYFQKALQSSPDDEATFKILANCYARSDTKMDDGIVFLESATQKYPDNATYFEYLAILYGKKGMADKSNAAFKKSQALKSGN